jgi:hypothetical protein
VLKAAAAAAAAALVVVVMRVAVEVALRVQLLPRLAAWQGCVHSPAHINI